MLQSQEGLTSIEWQFARDSVVAAAPLLNDACHNELPSKYAGLQCIGWRFFNGISMCESWDLANQVAASATCSGTTVSCRLPSRFVSGTPVHPNLAVLLTSWSLVVNRAGNACSNFVVSCQIVQCQYLVCSMLCRLCVHLECFCVIVARGSFSWSCTASPEKGKSVGVRIEFWKCNSRRSIRN